MSTKKELSKDQVLHPEIYFMNLRNFPNIFSKKDIQCGYGNVDFTHFYYSLNMERQRIIACHERCKITRILRSKCKYIHILHSLTNTQVYNTRKNNSNKFLDAINFSWQYCHKYFIFGTSSSFTFVPSNSFYFGIFQ